MNRLAKLAAVALCATSFGAFAFPGQPIKQSFPGQPFTTSFPGQPIVKAHDTMPVQP